MQPVDDNCYKCKHPYKEHYLEDIDLGSVKVDDLNISLQRSKLKWGKEGCSCEMIIEGPLPKDQWSLNSYYTRF